MSLWRWYIDVASSMLDRGMCICKWVGDSEQYLSLCMVDISVSDIIFVGNVLCLLVYTGLVEFDSYSRWIVVFFIGMCVSYSFLTVEIYTSRMYLILMCRAVSIYEKKGWFQKSATNGRLHHRICWEVQQDKRVRWKYSIVVLDRPDQMIWYMINNDYSRTYRSVHLQLSLIPTVWA